MPIACIYILKVRGWMWPLRITSHVETWPKPKPQIVICPGVIQTPNLMVSLVIHEERKKWIWRRNKLKMTFCIQLKIGWKVKSEHILGQKTCSKLCLTEYYETNDYTTTIHRKPRIMFLKMWKNLCFILILKHF